MRKFIIAVIPLFFAMLAHGQDDSLKQLLQTETKDTSRILLYRGLSGAYEFSKPDTALHLASQGLALARATGFKRGEALCLGAIGNILNSTGNYPRALELFLQSLKIAEEIKDETLIADILNYLSDVYFYSGDISRSIAYSHRVIEISRKLNNEPVLYSGMLNLGDTYEKSDQFDSALFYTTQAYNYAMKIQDLSYLEIILINLGNIYSKMNRRDSAMIFFRSANGFLKETNNDGGLAESYLGMAKLFLKAGQTDSCLYYANLSFSISRNAGFTQDFMQASNFLAEYYKSVRNIDSAYAYQSVTITAKDSLFSQQKSNEIQGMNYSEAIRLQQIEEDKEKAQAQLRQNALLGGSATLLITAFLLFINNRQKRKANDLLQKQKHEIENQRDQTNKALQELQQTQKQLIQSEKMASLGELTAGIAHEIQNPLNFVNNFSEVNGELISELVDEVDKGNYDEVKVIAVSLKDNEKKIVHHGKRADAIVKSMLQHSRINTAQKEPTDINALCDEYLRLSYYGLRAKDKNFNAGFTTDLDESIGKVNIIAQDIGRVLLNLFNNAFYAVNEKTKLRASGYEPRVIVKTKKINDTIEIKVIDNGNGIPKNIIDKIFQPFFTTKPTGQGTGLGLSLAYDIITKEHNGTIKVESSDDKGSEFIITLEA